MSEPVVTVIPDGTAAVAWWFEKGEDDVWVCFDLENGETVSISVSDAAYGGLIE